MVWPTSPRPRRTLSPEVILATWFGTGFLRPASGTWGALAAIPPAWLIAGNTHSWALLIAAAVVFPFGWYASERALTGIRSRDPSWIVVDEVVGQWIALSVLPRNLLYWLCAFLVFRMLDIAKPWPIDMVDRRVKGGLGIMLDDVVAGTLAALFMFFAKWLFWIPE